MTRLMLSAISLLALAGCAGGPDPEVSVRTETVYVERAVSCVPENLGDTPTFPDTDQALSSADDAAARYALLWAGRLLRMARLGETEPVIATCREAGDE